MTNLNSNNSGYGVCFGNNIFIAVGNKINGSNDIIYSSDGIKWNQTSTSISSTSGYYAKL